MALTQPQWYAKISKFVPSWYFEKKEVPHNFTVGLFNAIAAVFQQIQADTDSAQASTFIRQAAAPVLDLHGDERSIPRTAGELDAAYAPRIQTGIFVSVGKAQLQAVIDACLNNTPAFLIENFEYGFYDDADLSTDNGFLYYDDYWSRWLDLTKWYNWWTVIIPVQSGGVNAAIQAAIINAIEQNKALGTTYDVMYGIDFTTGGEILTESGGGLLTEGGDHIVLE